MGRLIDTSDLHNKVMLNKSDWGIFATQIDNLIEGVVMQVSTVEAIPKSDYENRLKADMVAMLEEIQLEADENLKKPYCLIIQQKINSLKENTDGNKND